MRRRLQMLQAHRPVYSTARICPAQSMRDTLELTKLDKGSAAGTRHASRGILQARTAKGSGPGTEPGSAGRSGPPPETPRQSPRRHGPACHCPTCVKSGVWWPGLSPEALSILIQTRFTWLKPETVHAPVNFLSLDWRD